MSRAAGVLFISVVLLSPIPFGAIPAWAWALAAGLIATAAIAFAFSGHMAEFVAEWGRRLRLPVFGFALVLVWVALQLADLGIRSRNPNATLAGLIHLTTYGLVFLLAVASTRDQVLAGLSLRLVAVGGLIIALYAVVSWRFAPDSLLWTRKAQYHGSATGTFVNRNTFATYAGLILLAITAIILSPRSRTADDGAVPGFARFFLSRLILHVERNWFWIFAWITVLFALLLSGSRAGTLSTVIGMIALVLLPGRSEPRGRQSGKSVWWKLGAVALVVVGVLTVYLVGGTGLTSRILDGDIRAEAAERLALYELALRAIADSFWTGHGLGAFMQVFELYRTTQPSLQPGSEFAHNTYLDIALGLGVPAAIVFYAVLAHCGYQCFRGVERRRRGRVYPALGAAATILVGVHSLFDFSLEIAAVAIAYAFLLGLGFAQAWPRIPSEPTDQAFSFEPGADRARRATSAYEV